MIRLLVKVSSSSLTLGGLDLSRGAFMKRLRSSWSDGSLVNTKTELPNLSSDFLALLIGEKRAEREVVTRNADLWLVRKILCSDWLI